MRLVLTAVAVLAVSTTACGGIEHEPNLAKALEQTEATGSSRIEVTATGSGFGRKSELICRGAADYETRRLQLSCGDGYGDFIAIDDTLYFRDGSGLSGGDEHRWVRTPDSDSESSIHDLSPVTILAKLRAASLETERVDEADVRGTRTVEYVLTVDCEKADLGCDDEKATVPVSVWIDDDGLVRRVFLVQHDTEGTVEFFDFGVDVDIRPPPAELIDDGASSPVEPCTVGGGSPVTDDRALDVLRRHGFSIEREKECSGRVVAMLIGMAGKPADAEFVSCRLYAAPSRDAPSTPKTDTFGGVATVSLENVRCSILAGGVNEAEGLVRLEDAFGELDRSIDP